MYSNDPVIRWRLHLEIWLSIKSTYNGYKHNPEIRVTWSTDSSCLLLVAHRSPWCDASNWESYNSLPCLGSSLLHRMASTGCAHKERIWWLDCLVLYFHSNYLFIFHWQLTTQHLGFKYQVQSAENLVSVPTRLRARCQAGGSHKTVLTNVRPLRDTPKALFPSYTPLSHFVSLQTGKIDAIKINECILKFFLAQQIQSDDLLQAIM